MSYNFSSLPTNLGIAVQRNYLKRKFELALKAELGFRGAATRSVFPGGIGMTLSRTKPGRLAPITAPLNPANNVPFTNGLTTTPYYVEQYTTTVEQYAGATPDLNLIDDVVNIASIFLKNSENLGEQAFRSLDGLVLNTLQNAYLGGNTRVDSGSGASLTVHVDDIRGFEWALATVGLTAGIQTPISPANPLPVIFTDLVNSTFTTYNAVGAVRDVTNNSTAKDVGGWSGTLTFSSTVAGLDNTVGNAVTSVYAPVVIRANAKRTTALLTSGDFLKLENIRQAVTVLNNNNIPTMDDGFYNCYLDPTNLAQLFSDQEFQLLYRGTQLDNPVYRNMSIISGLKVRFYTLNQTPQQTLNNVQIHRPFICGKDVVMEDYFPQAIDAVVSGQGAHPSLYKMSMIDNIRMIVRGQIDPLAQFIAQAWTYIAGWQTPTDSLITPVVLNTASNSYFKRGVFIETA